MTTAQAQIYELFKALPIEDQRELLCQLSEAVEGEVSLDGLSAEDVAAIEEGIAQAERGEVVDADELFDRLAQKFGFRADVSVVRWNRHCEERSDEAIHAAAGALSGWPAISPRWIASLRSQ